MSQETKTLNKQMVAGKLRRLTCDCAEQWSKSPAKTPVQTEKKTTKEVLYQSQIEKGSNLKKSARNRQFRYFDLSTDEALYLNI